MDVQQIRFMVFLGVFLLMLALESVIQRHPTVDSKKNRLKILKEISTNPLYEQFNQIYFHAGDRYQYQKYGYLKTRMLKYPDKHIKNDSIFNNYIIIIINNNII